MDTCVSNPLRQCTLDELRRRTSAKWRVYPGDVLPMWIAEMDVPLAAPVAGALHEAIDAGDTGYAMGDVYAEALDGFAQRDWSWRVPPERAAIVPDVMLGVVEVLKLITSPGDAVVVNSPVYPPFYEFVSHMDRRVVEAPLTEEGRIDLDTLARAFRTGGSAGPGGSGGPEESRGAAAYLLCSPHNPTGTVHTAEELTAVTRLAAEHGVRVVADEIHAPLVLPGARHVPYLSIPGTERAFSLLSASKAWNLAGLKAAMAVAGPDAAGELARMPEEVSHGPSHLGVIGHVAAFRHGGPWLEALLTGLDENRQLLSGLLKRHLPEVRYRSHEGTFLAWLDCRALGLGDDPAAAFLERGRVALIPGPAFGTGGAGHARLNIGTSPEILEEAVKRMAAAV
ncbi:MalY/PatB family protein [Streptomyces marispadix]|uniref:cysteine-S-conjugate beta-lyase n=1 Tax=Streptomyces marispadix TaxID=2922868 RepID=A0ABS9SV36_9ACTN|nr:MalY/PatB family protein [Streptomyces marispadix]MCH6160144.1 pyridoxal phosphate-dependent aminotransferase [Streptomyces marispadix]